MGDVVKWKSAYIGFDPGMTGSAFALRSDSRIISEIRFENATPADICQWYRDLETKYRCVSCLEQVGAMPGQGVSSSFKFGRGYGMLEGMLSALQARYTYVRPQIWQGALKCLTGGNKNVAKAAAERLWPRHKFTLKTADGCLIAEYLRQRELGLLIGQGKATATSPKVRKRKSCKKPLTLLSGPVSTKALRPSAPRPEKQRKKTRSS